MSEKRLESFQKFDVRTETGNIFETDGKIRLLAFKRLETIQRSEALKLSSAFGPTATIPLKIAGSIGFGKFTKVTK